jgi:hypothetical protein
MNIEDLSASILCAIPIKSDEVLLKLVYKYCLNLIRNKYFETTNINYGFSNQYEGIKDVKLLEIANQTYDLIGNQLGKIKDRNEINESILKKNKELNLELINTNIKLEKIYTSKFYKLQAFIYKLFKLE